MPAGDQVGIGSSAGPGQSFGIHDHDKPSEGGVLSPAENRNTLGSPGVQPLYPRAFPYPLMGLFGDGSDGDFDNGAGLTVLTKDMNFRNLHVLAGGILYAAGFIIRVWGKCTVDLGGIICCDGFDGVDGRDDNGVGGAGGVGATITPISRYLLWNGPFDGGKGGDGVGLGKATAIGGPLATSFIGFIQAFGILFQAVGGGGGGGIGLAAGPGAKPTDAAITYPGKAGGPSIIVGIGVAVNIGGGGGGGGGGAMELFANEIDNSGRITCRGGKGGNGYFATVGAASSFSGNGSGGNGGILRGGYRKLSGAGLGTIDCLGGLPGVNGNGGLQGTTGIAEMIQIGA